MWAHILRDQLDVDEAASRVRVARRCVQPSFRRASSAAPAASFGSKISGMRAASVSSKTTPLRIPVGI
jgi:hypothetical protein